MFAVEEKYSLDQPVFIDFETSGLSPKNDCIAQMCAIHGCTILEHYVTPVCAINPKAAEITSITYDCRNKIMTHQNKEVEHYALCDVLQMLFLMFRNY